jgi:hypothetical protein
LHAVMTRAAAHTAAKGLMNLFMCDKSCFSVK